MNREAPVYMGWSWDNDVNAGKEVKRMERVMSGGGSEGGMFDGDYWKREMDVIVQNGVVWMGQGFRVIYMGIYDGGYYFTVDTSTVENGHVNMDRLLEGIKNVDGRVYEISRAYLRQIR
jgi:hypothetical protein